MPTAALEVGQQVNFTGALCWGVPGPPQSGEPVSGGLVCFYIWFRQDFRRFPIRKWTESKVAKTGDDKEYSMYTSVDLHLCMGNPPNYTQKLLLKLD